MSRRLLSLALVAALLITLAGTIQAYPQAPRPGAAPLSLAPDSPDNLRGRTLAARVRPQATRRSPSALTPDPLIQLMIEQVVTSTVLQYERELAGEVPVWVDGGWYTITSRLTYSGTPIEKATHYVGQHFASLGLDVEYQNWSSSTNPNVVGELHAPFDPDDVWIICAHLDDVWGTPGADDNASGSVAVLIAADILTQYEWGCTLRFALWTGEEQGLLGSAAYAHRAQQNGENIVGVLNLDMIAYNTKGSSPGIDLYYNPGIAATQQLALLFADVVPAYGLNLVPQVLTGGPGGSDHQSFWSHGYSAILAIEDEADFNPQYHKPGDTPANNDLLYFTEYVKASLGTFVHMSGCLIPFHIYLPLIVQGA